MINLRAFVDGLVVAKTQPGRESAVTPGPARIPATTPLDDTNQDELASGTRTPGGQQGEEVGHVHAAVGVEISKAVWRAWTPLGQEEQEVGDAHDEVAVYVG